MTQTTALAPNKPGLAGPGSDGLARLGWYTLTNAPLIVTAKPSCEVSRVCAELGSIRRAGNQTADPYISPAGGYREANRHM